MYEWNPNEKGQRDQTDLEKRLSTYYGPELREQALPASSWLRLRGRLGSQLASRHWRMSLHIRRVHRRTTPAYVQTAFARIVHEAHLPWSSSLLRCTFKANVRVPSVRISLFARRNIRLILPSNLTQTVESSELDVLLATGLARYFYLRKPAYMLLHVLDAALVTLACVALVLLWESSIPYVMLLIAIALCAIFLGFAHIKGRKLGFRADDLMVRWLGRSTVCHGLHALAEREYKHYQVRWGEPSLAKRINRICGAQVTVEDERLTLAR